MDYVHSQEKHDSGSPQDGPILRNCKQWFWPIYVRLYGVFGSWDGKAMDAYAFTLPMSAGRQSSIAFPRLNSRLSDILSPWSQPQPTHLDGLHAETEICCVCATGIISQPAKFVSGPRPL